jgi:sulfite dehydrogenase (quinone) subunit SoeA
MFGSSPNVTLIRRGVTCLSTTEPSIALSAPIGDEVKCTTCYMCACRCGIKVHLKDGRVRYIEGNRDHPVNKGVLCGKGAAGIMQHYSPARLTGPMKRVGPRGSGEFEAISWDEALGLATEWLGDIRESDPKKLAFFTGRDQSQALTGWFAQQFGTPNFAAHGGFCSVNMAAAGLYTFGGSFWEFGEPDWDRTKYFMLFGVAEDHASNPIKTALGKLKARGVKVVSINPIRTGYNAIADEWIGIRPGSDGMFVGALIHELLRTQNVDLDYLARYTNAPWLVIEEGSAADAGLIARDASGKPLCFDKKSGTLMDATLPDIAPALVGEFKLADGRTARPSFQLIAERYLGPDYAPEKAEIETGIPASTIRRIAAELADAAFKQQIELDIPWTDTHGRRHEKTTGRPVSMHAMRGISAHSNGFQTCRLIHILQIILGSIDCPGGFRYKPPFPRPTPPPNKPAGKHNTVRPMTPLAGAPLGFTQGPEDLLVCPDGQPERIDKAYSWDAPIAAHGLMHMVITNAANGDPYPVDVLFMYMANMSWNSSMNTPAILRHLTETDPATGAYKIPKIIYSDAYNSEMVAYADLILPDTTYLERWDCISVLDRPISDPDAAADSIRHPVVEPDRDVRAFQSVVIDLGARLKLPGFVNADGSPKYPGGYPDYIVNHERAPGIGPLAGFRGLDGKSYGKGAVNPKQLDDYIANGAFHQHHLDDDQRFYKHANKSYLEWAKSIGFVGSADPIIFQLYLEPLQKFRLAARGHGSIQPPDTHRKRIETYFDPIPFFYGAERLSSGEPATVRDSFPMYAITQRPMHMYHSWGSQNAWLRQITAENRLYIHRSRAESLDLKDDDWAWVVGELGRVRAQVRLVDGVNPDTVWTWNAIGKRSGAWGLDVKGPEETKGFLLNHLIGELLPVREGGYRFSNSDPVTGQAAWYDLRVRIEKADPEGAKETWPRFESIVSKAASSKSTR